MAFIFAPIGDSRTEAVTARMRCVRLQLASSAESGTMILSNCKVGRYDVDYVIGMNPSRNWMVGPTF